MGTEQVLGGGNADEQQLGHLGRSTFAICLGFGKHQTLRPTEAPTTARLAKMSPFRDGEEPPWPSDAAI